MRLLAECFPEFANELDKIDEVYGAKTSLDEKTKQLFCFAMAIKNRSKPCLIKHFKGALEAGATVRDIAEIMALTFRESAGGDDCWTHDALGDFKQIMKENIKCCPK
ncbi:MAG: carboxymuconolactone decarboxylase family protein [Candidatus Diapherotrites archaeon]|nr:carboxymuconolactone decarboxylase family protein [Candidatus Diapherotrites archaeon]